MRIAACALQRSWSERTPRREPSGRPRHRRPAQHVVEHRLGEPAGEGVLLARVEATPSTTQAARTASAPRRRGRTAAAAAAPARPAARQRGRAAPCQANAPSATTDPQRRQQQRQLARRATARRCRARRASARWPAARSGPPRPSGCRPARWPSPACVLVGWVASPARCSAANSQSPLRSPVKMRPVRLPPCAAGASPTTSTRGIGVAPARDRPAPVRLGRRRPAASRPRPARATRPAAGRPGRPRRAASSSASVGATAASRRRRRGRARPAWPASPGRPATRCRARTGPATGQPGGSSAGSRVRRQAAWRVLRRRRPRGAGR